MPWSSLLSLKFRLSFYHSFGSSQHLQISYVWGIFDLVSLGRRQKQFPSLLQSEALFLDSQWGVRDISRPGTLANRRWELSHCPGISSNAVKALCSVKHLRWQSHVGATAWRNISTTLLMCFRPSAGSGRLRNSSSSLSKFSLLY